MDEYQSVEVLIQKPGEVIRPSISLKVVECLVKDLYGLKVVEIKELNSYEDRNFYIKISEDIQNEYIKDTWPHGYTFKVLNSLESQNSKLIEAQNKLMEYLNSHGIRCPVPVPTVNNHYLTIQNLTASQKKEDISQVSNIVRLLTYIPGKLLINVDYTTELLQSTGAFLSELHVIMKGFQEPSFNDRISIWSMSSFPHILEFLYVVSDVFQHSLVLEVIESFKKNVQTQCSGLPKGIIHGDFNEQNILVQQAPDTQTYLVNGILDFADVQNSYYIFDIAIAIMYMMLESKIIDPIDVGGYILAGYMKLRLLENSEWKVLKICIAARFCVSLVMGLYNHSLDPKNEYVLITQKRGWEILQKLWVIPENKLISGWRQTIDSLQ